MILFSSRYPGRSLRPGWSCVRRSAHGLPGHGADVYEMPADRAWRRIGDGLVGALAPGDPAVQHAGVEPTVGVDERVDGGIAGAAQERDDPDHDSPTSLVRQSSQRGLPYSP